MSQSAAGHRTFSFGDYVFDIDRGALRKGGRDVPLRPKSFMVLSYLVEHHGLLVTRDELLKAVWADVIVTEDSLTKCLIEIRKALGDDAHNMVRTVPRRGYLFDLPVTVHLPGEESDIPAAGLNPTGNRRPSPWSMGAVFVLALAIAATWWSTSRQQVEERAPTELRATPLPSSIAILPFADMSPEGDQEYFGDGISEEILNLLAQTPELTVIARTSSFSFKGKKADIKTIAQKLNVSNVLEGSVRKEGDRIRITAQLVDAASGAHLWSQTYNRDLAEMFAVQDEISVAIVAALKENLGFAVEAVPRVIAAANIEAHEAYLRGRYLMARRWQASVEGAILEFEKAIALDPHFALAHAELAIAICLGYADLTDAQAIARATPHVEQALALDPTLAEAHAAAGVLAWTWQNLAQIEYLEEVLSHFEKAIQINPSYSDVYHWIGNILHFGLGRYKESFAMREKALQLDPLSIPAISNYAHGLIERNRLAEADRELEKLASIAPGIYARMRGYRLSLGGKWASLALGELEALQVNSGRQRSRVILANNLALLGLDKEALAVSEHPRLYTLRILGKPSSAVAVAEAFLADNPTSLDARDSLGLALAGAGNYARARPLLEDAWQRRDGRINATFWIENVAALITIRLSSGEDDGIDDLLAAIRDNVRRYHEAGISVFDHSLNANYETGLAAFLAGERERGLALIGKAARNGYFILPNEAYLQALYDDPGFAPILAGQQSRQTRERDRFLAIVCNNNPYAAVWQPAEGTCERFSTMGGN